MIEADIRSNMEILLRTAELTAALEDSTQRWKDCKAKLDEEIERVRDYLDSCVGDHDRLGMLDQEIAKLRQADQDLDSAVTRSNRINDQLNLIRWVVGGDT